MTTSGRRLGLAALAAGIACLAAVWASGVRAAATEPLRGLWTAERSTWKVDTGGTATFLQLSMHERRAHGDSQHSETIPLEELSGLTPAQIDASAADVRFDWKRDAGVFGFEGRFETGAGAGHFTFTPSAEYVADMRKRGYTEVDEQKAMTLAIFDVSRAFIGEMAAAGYDHVPLEKLVALRIHGATPEFVKAMAALGYRGLPLDRLIAFRIHGVSPEFVKAMRELGYADNTSAEQLVAFRIHGVSPEFLRELRGLGYAQLAAEQLVAFRIHGVDAGFVKDVKALGYDPRPDELVALRIHGVSPDFIKRAQGQKGKQITLDRLVGMKIHGQEPD